MGPGDSMTLTKMSGTVDKDRRSKKKQQQKEEITLEEKIKHLTSQYSNNPNEQTHNELRLLKTHLEAIIHKKTQFIIQQLKYENFQYSNKSSKYLANLLQFKKEKAIIPSILDTTSGLITNNSQDINNVFHNFYKNLYSSDHNPSQSETDLFLNNLHLPTLSIEQANFLDAHLTSEELHKALNTMPNQKSPGPDGLPAEFYKHFWKTLSPLFYRVTTEIKTTSTIPTHMNTAIITLILKPNKDPTHPSSYRPLSLINTDLKIITKAITTRIETVTPLLSMNLFTHFKL